MCTGGNLRHLSHPDSFNRKRMQILTTSQVLSRSVEQWQCQESHCHLQIAGSCRVPGLGRMPVSRYTELYTQTFARRISQIIQLVQNQEEQIVKPVFAVLEGEPEVKRRRI